MTDRIRTILEFGVAIGAVKASDVAWMVASCPSPKIAREHVVMMRRHNARTP